MKIGNIAIPEFHYYLTVGVERRTFLLGDDFISCCTFSHAYNSDILINGFNNKVYVEKFKHKKFLTDKDIVEIFEMAEAIESATKSNIFEGSRSVKALGPILLEGVRE